MHCSYCRHCRPSCHATLCLGRTLQAFNRQHNSGSPVLRTLLFSEAKNAGAGTCQRKRAGPAFKTGPEYWETATPDAADAKQQDAQVPGNTQAGTRCDGKGNIAARQSLTKTPDVRGTMTRTQAQIWSTATPNGTAREAIRTCRPTIALSSYRPATIYRCSFSGKSYLLTACPLQKSAGHNYR